VISTTTRPAALPSKPVEISSLLFHRMIDYSEVSYTSKYGVAVLTVNSTRSSYPSHFTPRY
jgi:hypothetical protein